MRFRNVNDATVAGMRELLSRGHILNVRNQEIREIRNRITVIERPQERCLFIPHRNNNIFTAIAETIWVLAGRNDIAWLQAYLPRAAEFSDDGLTWRAGYGPRLRNWDGIDQLQKTRDLLLAEATTRRAAMSLYDPAQDFVDSKDIPCNNWLHWIIRGGKLHLNVAVRSNDIIWGFSGVNCFEWSVLQEMMAFWLGVGIGDVTYIASSFHLYKRHYALAEKAAANYKGISPHDYALSSPPFCTRWGDFQQSFNTWFELEAEIRKDPASAPDLYSHLSDPFLTSSLEMIRLYHGAIRGWDSARLRIELCKMRPTDFTAAAYDFFARKNPDILEDIQEPTIAQFFAAYNNSAHPGSSREFPHQLLNTIKTLHREKDAAYGFAWKRRGELTSILANIARKVDRLVEYKHRAVELTGEAAVDTAIDLFVYAIKYQLFLLERLPQEARSMLPGNALQPYSDHVSNFDWLVDNLICNQITWNAGGEATTDIFAKFEHLHALASNPESMPEERLQCAIAISSLAFILACQFCAIQPQMAKSI